MPKRTFEIEWDTPDDPDWLDALSLSLMLEDSCGDTLWTVRYAAEVTRAERERCAKIADADRKEAQGLPELPFKIVRISTARRIAAAIREDR